MSNIPISDIAPSEIPDGFTFADPTGSAAGGGAPSQSSNDAAAQREAQRQAILEQAMTPEALARLRRVKLVKKERASAVEAMIANMALQGKIDSKITEGKLIEMLEGIVGAQQKQAADAGKIHIQRKKYNFDSDDEDDNDDDLL
ncbi:hypothetical protein HJC23_000498 [Cyclotella cryptica]|eukprot:CCRYP_019674-RA/>CCRYP_019674-RA protein AED:0.17 eAED:0.17 QI:216/1/1/1/1/1/2/537/143